MLRTRRSPVAMLGMEETETFLRSMEVGRGIVRLILPQALLVGGSQAASFLRAGTLSILMLMSNGTRSIGCISEEHRGRGSGGRP